MKYFYIHPFKPQYFFPKGFKKHEVFISFFKPYSRIGEISWGLFRTFWLYRVLFGKRNIEAFIPEKAIRKIIGLEPLMAFNTGTLGADQKITGLGKDKNDYFFIKYAQTPIAIKNVVNEHHILSQISTLKFVPKIQYFYQDEKQVLLKTDVLNGTKLGNVLLDEIILKLLFKLSELSITSKNKSESSIKTVFSHGDFCPWNMMEQKGQVLLFDWEMGGYYPLGYDLFTFLFQSKFLLEPEKPIQSILLENKDIIDNYFTHFNISEWNSYLFVFSKVKVDLEKEKGAKSMLSQYKILLDYAEKA
ncbi:phosphotransferase [Lutibacter flavus]|uniref:Phosphotransferase enzyme family protein n=1 Tax=Lutibacter flavus TaxID=691689 RepID=A0A238VS42_9FLAO|nr:phosphotransferase [Lutibacter flavus]SNR36967.1 Phosphotransferase enzyme family protein [Lutibacter flavus]